MQNIVFVYDSSWKWKVFCMHACHVGGQVRRAMIDSGIIFLSFPFSRGDEFSCCVLLFSLLFLCVVLRARGRPANDRDGSRYACILHCQWTYDVRWYIRLPGRPRPNILIAISCPGHGHTHAYRYEIFLYRGVIRLGVDYKSFSWPLLPNMCNVWVSRTRSTTPIKTPSAFVIVCM